MPNMLFPKIAVAHDAELAAQLGLPLINLPPGDNSLDFLLVKTPNYLELRQLGKGTPSPLFVDFLDKALLYRKDRSTHNNEAIAKAVGLKYGKTLNIIDATAGLGKDAFILASLGANITLLERSPIIAALLEDGLARAYNKLPFTMQLIKADAIDFLSNCSLESSPDVVYLDPMFPPREKSAAVKKDIRMLQLLLGTDTDEEALLQAALACAKSRVVVKRPSWAKLPTNRKPDMKITTPNHYFAVYINSF